MEKEWTLLLLAKNLVKRENKLVREEKEKKDKRTQRKRKKNQQS